MNRIVPREALGAGVDGHERGEIARIYTPANVKAMLTAGFGPITYRLRTELACEAWHWNPRGQWSDPGHRQGYWISDSEPGAPILVSYGYRLPRRGNTEDQAADDGYSRLDDGDAGTFWKSNPYLDSRFTGEDESRHPQWLVIGFRRVTGVNAVRVLWGEPYAASYRVQYWRYADPANMDESDPGEWRTFPSGAISEGRGGAVTIRLASGPIPTRFVRILMTHSSVRAPSGTPDVRDQLGFAVREVYVGSVDGAGRFGDAVVHSHSRRRQSMAYVSSTDPWHRERDLDRNLEQPGFDKVFGSGLTRGLPVLIPAPVLYGTPEDAAAELRYLRARGCATRGIELGEEPDHQFMEPEDYGALYSQWADALRAVDPAVVLGGPSLETLVGEVRMWPADGDSRSWAGNFIRYLRSRGRLRYLGFFSFEWYPFDDVGADPARQILRAPGMLASGLARLRRDGVPAGIPWLMTEYGYSAFAAQAEVDLPGALLDADIVGRFLAAGGSAAYLFGLEPASLFRESKARGLPSWGNQMLFVSDDNRQIRAPVAAYWGARLLTRAWAQPSGERLAVYPAATDARDARGHEIVTAYALRGSGRRWSILLVNKDRSCAWLARIRIAGRRYRTLAGPASIWRYGAAQYHWRASGPRGGPDRNLPPARSTLSAGARASVRLPPFSITVIRSAE